MICNKENCSACQVCVESCPKDAIIMQQDKYGVLYPQIDMEKCVHCSLCKNVCPTNRINEFRFPLSVYAGWSADKDRRDHAASGGIATEIYRYALANNIFIMGTCFDRKTGVVYREISVESDIEWARDSKYVYSDMSNCFAQYGQQLNNGRKCIFIGLPCQVAAIKNYVKKFCNHAEGLFLTVDIICHGVPPFSYLDEHLSYVEKRTKQNIAKISFRNSCSSYILKCFSVDEEILYQKGMHANDTYYRGFAVNLNFRENCYHCLYARNERISDITIGDYAGLGNLWPYIGKKQQMSVVLCASEKGNQLLNKLANKDYIWIQSRPLAEPASAISNAPLRHPPVAYKKRSRFLEDYVKLGSFEKASQKALYWPIFFYNIMLPYRVLKNVAKFFINKVRKCIKIGNRQNETSDS